MKIGKYWIKIIQEKQTQEKNNNKFIENLGDLFDIAHTNAFSAMKIEEDCY